ncbi:MAG TPA: DNA methyltransferase, partial [Myxococcota bacterium]|nr:DNA methyltransferase [Myxococcota bacterium]
RLVPAEAVADLESCLNRTILGDCRDVLRRLPAASIDLIVADPPYNMTKTFSKTRFRRQDDDAYAEWLDSWLSLARLVMKETASIYVCSEWRSSGLICQVLERHFMVRNRITWEREKGRGALRNWKNCSEDIWFATVSDDYYFDVDAVKQKRRVVAPYRDASGAPKDWVDGDDGAYRITHPSNLWTDISVPFWSMPENTDHPTQKPEKLIAKLVLANSRPGDLILDPFAGSGTTAVVAAKLGRRHIGIETELEYCLLGEARLQAAAADQSIQGYSDGYFWDRNTLAEQRKVSRQADDQSSLFEVNE